MTNDYSEDALVEQPAIELFKELQYDYANCFDEKVGHDSTLGRQTTEEVVLVPKLRNALLKLNPDLPKSAIEEAIEQITEDKSALNPGTRQLMKALYQNNCGIVDL